MAKLEGLMSLNCFTNKILRIRKQNKTKPDTRQEMWVLCIHVSLSHIDYYCELSYIFTIEAEKELQNSI